MVLIEAKMQNFIPFLIKIREVFPASFPSISTMTFSGRVYKITGKKVPATLLTKKKRR